MSKGCVKEKNVDKKDNMNAIKAIEDKYGLVLFRMGLSHLVDVGVRHFDEETVAASFKAIEEKDKEYSAQGKIPIMTVEFQYDIIRCAEEFSKFSIWDLFLYIKKHVVIS